MKRLATILTTIALTATGVVAPVTAASARPRRDDVRCGATLTADTRLRRDLLDCPGIGLVIGADHITLDLNGHTIDGDGVEEPCTVDVPCDAGVINRAGHHDVTIKGGSIRQFGTGVFLATTEANRLQHLRITQSGEFGLSIFDSRGTDVEDNLFDENGTSGMVVVRSRLMVLNRNRVTGSRGFGVATFDLQKSRITNNKFDQNDHGIAVFGDSTDNLIRGNKVNHSGGSAIDLAGGSRNRVEFNWVADNGDGIILGGEERRATVSGNEVTGTGFYGFPDTIGAGVILDGADNNTVRRNRVVGGRGPAILVTKLDSPTTADDNTVNRNTAHSSASDGILIGEGTTGTRVRRNIAFGNGDDGIEVDAPATEVTHNLARRNADLGIEAVAGVRDGGSNQASSNGDPRQCTAILCRG